MPYLILGIIAAFIGGVFYFVQPTLTWGFYGIPITITLIGAFIVFITEGRIKSVLVIGLFGWFVLPFLTSSAIFHSSSYKELLGEVKEKQFTEDVSPIDIDKVRVVDQDLAEKLGEKLLGSEPALGSIVTLGEFNIQLVNGELKWVSPLLHSGFFKWMNKSGTPGYITVSATNPSDVKLVTNINGEPINIKYQPKAYFGENLARHLYFSGFMTTGLTDYSFELDENGNPFYIVTTFKKRIGFSGSDATGVAIVNPQTGEVNQYHMGNIPEWVDRVQPENFVTDQIDDWGLYVNGWINALFTKEDTLQTSKGMSLVYGSDNKSYWYTGMTSSGGDSSTVGFMLVNTKTKEAKWYKQSGATEDKAEKSAEGEVQEKNYSATSPILYNVLGLPTYVTTLKDNEGLVKLIAFISVEQYSIVGTGKTIKDALRNYKSLLTSSGSKTDISTSFDLVSASGTVKRISFDVKDGNSFYYFTIDVGTHSSKIFMTSSSLSDKIILTEKGDKVEFEFEKTDKRIVDLVKFTNSSL